MGTGQTRDTFIRSSEMRVCALDNIEDTATVLTMMVGAMICRAQLDLHKVPLDYHGMIEISVSGSSASAGLAT